MKPADQFKTKTIFKKRQNIKTDGFWPIALDVGYSAVKGFSPNHVYCFPSFAKQYDDNKEETGMGTPGVYDIKYKDENGVCWYVGYLAQDRVKSDDTNDSETTLYGRNRYRSAMFKVITRVGLALGMMDNEYGARKVSDKIVVQAGLPPKYKNKDTRNIVDVTAGHHSFELKVGKSEWKHFEFDILPENVLVMAQPMGALWSIACNNDGRFIKDAGKYFNSKLLVFDPGFGTVDLFSIMNTDIMGYETFSDLGMKRVFLETIKKVYDEYGIELSVIGMQTILKDGKAKLIRPETMESKNINITPILNEMNEKVCMEALERSKQAYNFFQEFDYFVIDGGTGSAWRDYIKNHLKNMETLTIVDAIQNDTLPNFFANARGYYLYLNISLANKK